MGENRDLMWFTYHYPCIISDSFQNRETLKKKGGKIIKNLGKGGSLEEKSGGGKGGQNRFIKARRAEVCGGGGVSKY